MLVQIHEPKADLCKSCKSVYDGVASARIPQVRCFVSSPVSITIWSCLLMDSGHGRAQRGPVAPSNQVYVTPLSFNTAMASPKKTLRNKKPYIPKRNRKFLFIKIPRQEGFCFFLKMSWQEKGTDTTVICNGSCLPKPFASKIPRVRKPPVQKRVRLDPRCPHAPPLVEDPECTVKPWTVSNFNP